MSGDRFGERRSQILLFGELLLLLILNLYKIPPERFSLQVYYKKIKIMHLLSEDYHEKSHMHFEPVMLWRSYFGLIVNARNRTLFGFGLNAWKAFHKGDGFEIVRLAEVCKELVHLVQSTEDGYYFKQR